MKNELIIKKCNSCGATVEVLKECNKEDCSISCCGTQMELMVPNSTEASKEKHIPKYKKEEDEIFVKLDHPMDEDHYIEWIALVKGKKEEFIYLKPGKPAECKFKYVPSSTIYAFCNKHGLWKKDVE